MLGLKKVETKIEKWSIEMFFFFQSFCMFGSSAYKSVMFPINLGTWLRY